MSDKYVVSANYIARDSVQSRWMVRPKDSGHIKNLQTSAVVLAKNVKFESSSWEEGFGCSTVAVCDSYRLFHYNQEGFKKLKFDGYSFADLETKLKVNECSELLLLEDGSMWYK
jgi:hypothetical protein